MLNVQKNRSVSLLLSPSSAPSFPLFLYLSRSHSFSLKHSLLHGLGLEFKVLSHSQCALSPSLYDTL